MRYWHYGHHCVQSRGGKVIGIDLTPELLERAKEDAALAGVTEGIEWKQGDAEDLPFPDNSFDIVFSSLGHMFTPRPEVAAKELIRVTKGGGRIAFTTWPPEHNVGRFFAAIVKHVPPPPGSPPSPMQWGFHRQYRSVSAATLRTFTSSEVPYTFLY